MSLFSGHPSHHGHGHHGRHHGHPGALDSLPMWQLVGSMRKRQDSTKPTCFVPSWLRRGGDLTDDHYDNFDLYISEEGEKAENESDGGVYQLRSLSSSSLFSLSHGQK